MQVFTPCSLHLNVLSGMRSQRRCIIPSPVLLSSFYYLCYNLVFFTKTNVKFPKLTSHLSDDSYIIGFQRASPIDRPSRIWRNKIWGLWGLAIPPRASRWYEEDYDDTDMSQWKL